MPGLSVQQPLTLTRHENNYLMIGIPTRKSNQSALSVYTLTTSIKTLNINNNQVMFKGNVNSAHLDAHLRGFLC